MTQPDQQQTNQKYQQMDQIINLAIPHVGQHILSCIDTSELLTYREVSKTWMELVDNVIANQWRDLIFPACQYGQTKVVEILLNQSIKKKRINWNVRDRSGRTPLMLACGWGQVDVVNLMINHQIRSKFRLNARDDYGWTPFMWACEVGHANVVDILIKNSKLLSINLNAKSINGLTGLNLAFKNGHSDVVLILQK